MKITIDFSNFDPAKIEQELFDDIISDIEEVTIDIFTDLTAPPPLGTPVDSGAARNSWQIDDSDPLAPEIYSMAPHIGRLNAGLSKQSPPGFVDASVDKRTR